MVKSSTLDCAEYAKPMAPSTWSCRRNRLGTTSLQLGEGETLVPCARPARGDRDGNDVQVTPKEPTWQHSDGTLKSLLDVVRGEFGELHVAERDGLGN